MERSVENFPSVMFPRLWNKADINAKEIKSLNRFKSTLKTSFLEQYKEFSCLKSNCFYVNN